MMHTIAHTVVAKFTVIRIVILRQHEVLSTLMQHEMLLNQHNARV